MTLKPANDSKFKAFIDKAKKFFVVNIKGYDPQKMVAATVLFEGKKEECEADHKKILNLAKQFQGMSGGPENGMRGYLLTFLIAYVRDFAFNHKVAAESFETSVPWSGVSQLCSRVKQRMRDECVALGRDPNEIWSSFRVTQIYETGAAVYVYFCMRQGDTPREHLVEQYERVEDAARDEVMKCGGSISHHHGVGKIRKQFIGRTMPDMAIEWQKNIKDVIDPKNIFAANNTIPRSDEERAKLAAKNPF